MLQGYFIKIAGHSQARVFKYFLLGKSIGHKSISEEISTQTIAKDTMKTMGLAGIDINKFKSHSTIIAAASKALDKGASIDEVMTAGRWKSRTVFDLFYNRSRGLNIANLILGMG